MQTDRVWWQRRQGLLVAVGIVVVAGCANRRETGATGRSVSRDDPATRSPHVVRVRTMHDSLAGIPIFANVVATSQQGRQDLEAAVVDSVPMPDHTRAFDEKSKGNDTARTWRIFWGSANRFDIDPLDAALPLEIGQEVLLAGFDATPSDPRGSDYWTRPARMVTGQVASIGTDGPVTIRVSADNYSCFRGGPVAARGSEGQWTVWGMTRSWLPGTPDSNETLLTVERLTEVAHWRHAAKARISSETRK